MTMMKAKVTVMVTATQHYRWGQGKTHTSLALDIMLLHMQPTHFYGNQIPYHLFILWLCQPLDTHNGKRAPSHHCAPGLDLQGREQSAGSCSFTHQGHVFLLPGQDSHMATDDEVTAYVHMVGVDPLPGSSSPQTPPKEKQRGACFF
jgi:hypothetical protein